MARRRKQSIDPNQGTLFDYFANNIEEIQKDNAREESVQDKKEVFHVRQTKQSTGSSKKNSQARNNSSNSSEGIQLSLLSYIGQVGTEQPERAESSRKQGITGIDISSRPTEHHREQDVNERLSMGSEATGDVRLGEQTEKAYTSAQQPAPSQATPQNVNTEAKAFERYAHAVNASRYRVTSIKMFRDGSKKAFILDKKDGASKGFTAEEMLQRMPQIQRIQNRRENFIIRPYLTTSIISSLMI